MAAPVGNQNAKKGKQWADAIKRAIRTKYGKEWDESLEELASGLVNAAACGDFQALKEIGDRLDGKPAQSVDVGNKDGEAFKTERIVREIVDPAKNPDA